MTLSSQHWGQPPPACTPSGMLLHDKVSMPSMGLLPFLLILLVPSVRQRKCQCPQRAYSHFYNANTMSKWLPPLMCQCPLRTYFHFYVLNAANEFAVESVSMPSTGLLPFLRILKKYLNGIAGCVNALYGLTSISTVASQNP